MSENPSPAPLTGDELPPANPPPAPPVTMDEIDAIIKKLLEARNGRNAELTEAEIQALCAESKQVFLSQPSLIDLEAPTNICGDIHGQYSDLLKMFDLGGYPPESNYVFLGDYVDRGEQGIETICLLLAYKIKYKDNVHLLRGNHESYDINYNYGFLAQCETRYNKGIWKEFNICFTYMPLAALISNKILCMHGGISKHLKDLDDIRNIVRPVNVPDEGLVCDLLWADPKKDGQGWEKSKRGISYTFGADEVTEFLQKHNLDLICRGHQLVQDGYEFFANRQLVTIFSAPNYCDSGNIGAMAIINADLTCKLKRFKYREDQGKMGSWNQQRPGTPACKAKGREFKIYAEF